MTTPAAVPLAVAMRQFECQLIMKTLEVAGGRKGEAAKLLKISRKGLWQKMIRHGITCRRRSKQRERRE